MAGLIQNVSQAFWPGLPSSVGLNGLAPCFVAETATTDLDLITYLKAIRNGRMRRGCGFRLGTCCCWPCWES